MSNVTVWLINEGMLEGRKQFETAEWYQLTNDYRSFSINKRHIIYIEGDR